MEKVYSELGISALPNVKIRYGQENSIKDLWKNIIAISDAEKRKKCIDDLLDILQANENQNGFFGKSDKVA